jgi:hypothetical protein
VRRLVVLIALGVAPLACVSEERVVVRSGAPCVGGVWVEGHYGPRGGWHPGHWRCPAVVEVVD